MNLGQKREIITTGDGSKTIHFPEIREQYHSTHGAIQESRHVFIDKGLTYYVKQNPSEPLRILEMGFGTGLNAFLTCLEAENQKINVQYYGIEAYPVSLLEIQELNYTSLIDPDATQIFQELHQSEWEDHVKITSYFELYKRQELFENIQDSNTYHIIYFDAFGARVQPELWTVAIFKKMFKALQSEGVLVTYAAKGSVRRAMQEVGFTVERLPGPPGKREMLRASKI
ncbi:tRNA (5-methylaminomethyl-2-thiouridine)(34)-methyltransferase MnmD [Aquimarina sp. ERC-38]|uniref:tRNA (5-methylaminomethyl-2-thiouridine)(34)-methyltransferase MnmD n=1 Tax=Aquimarina sp. ERC-38 TaxID=2949996 RepID=UPI002245AC7A|nr:tRNA (5-methylaminomethyl-2-thiouridine)(34)-methyltransferase MnmD [Aquimarina sp. ERC-38]UZO80916.1 tRNA (5-methylaminomethyl-2-thiouridine)(34)-methyltransferase MnmD [Aquimarina sp. ERC-38]